MDEMVCTFHHAKNKNNYKDSIRKKKMLEEYLKGDWLKQAVDTCPDFAELTCYWNRFSNFADYNEKLYLHNW